MKIRSVTCFVTVDETLSSELLRQAGELAQTARRIAPLGGYDVQTTRLAVQPLHKILRVIPPVEFARSFEHAWQQVGFDYGALAVETDVLFDHVSGMVRGTENLFASVRIASRAEGINLLAVQAAAHVIHDLAETTEDGLGNFRFTAAANVPAGVPFFPAAYHDGTAPTFAFATEAADLAVEAFTLAGDLDQARTLIVEALEREGSGLLKVGEELESKFGVHFVGIDFSLASYPEQGRSLATAMERLTGSRFGTRGTLFAAAFITDCLRRASFRRAGFSGLMLPLLEDWTMAARSQDGLYSLDSLLLYSTVCGTGLDTIPLAGDTTEDAIAALLLDLAALAVRLDKPLTARLIPVPGVRGGEITKFSFEYFANGRAFEIRADDGLKLFSGSKRVEFRENG